MLLKDRYSTNFLSEFHTHLQLFWPDVPLDTWFSEIHTPVWPSLALKARMGHIARVLAHYCPDDLGETADRLRHLTTHLLSQGWDRYALELMFIPELVVLKGMSNPALVLPLMADITPLTSCEYAIRPFILKYESIVLPIVQEWCHHPSEHVRRLASEGTRPRLPWAIALPSFKKNPNRTLPILKSLLQDPSPYVRRSVANHLNDISKDHPNWVLQKATIWIESHPASAPLLKHACRTVLKQGNPHALALFGYTPNPLLLVTAFEILTHTVSVPDAVQFSFTIQNHDQQAQSVRIEYAVYFCRSNGSLSKKVFKHSERTLTVGESLTIAKQHSFRPITTRTYHAGNHYLSIIINGIESPKKPFVLRINPENTEPLLHHSSSGHT